MRVGEYHFVTRVEQSGQGKEYGRGRSGGNDNAVRIHFSAVFLPVMLSYSLP